MQEQLNNSIATSSTGLERIHMAAAVANRQNERTQAMIAPRDRKSAEEAIYHMCRIKEWADKAFYSLSWIKTDKGLPTTGFTFEAANDLACVWGNIISESSFITKEGVTPETPCGLRSIYSISCTDLETNFSSKSEICIEHYKTVTNKQTKQNTLVFISDPVAIMHHCNAFISRVLRERILACIPLEIKHKAKAIIEETRNSCSDPQGEFKKIVAALAKYGVSRAQALAVIGLDEFNTTKLNGAHISLLRSIGVSIKENLTTISDWLDRDAKVSGQTLQDLPED